MSHLLQMRGLKHTKDAGIQIQYLSHLLQMRGLKLDREGYRTRRQEVASFTDAWIETTNQKCLITLNYVASFTDAWIETLDLLTLIWYISVASFTDAWIETQRVLRSASTFNVASFTDAWIETKSKRRLLRIAASHLLQMRGLKHPFEHGYRRNQ